MVTNNHLSVSQISMFLRCPMQYEFRYIKGIKIPPAGAMIEGTAYHAAIANDLWNKKETGELLPDSEIGDVFSTSFDHQVKTKGLREDEVWEEFEQIDWQGEDPGQLKDEGIKLAQLYHNTVANTIEPVEIEERKETTIAGFPFVFIADVVEAKRVIDHKVKKKRFSEDELKKDLQATTYSMIYQRPFEFHVAVKSKTWMNLKPAKGETEQDKWIAKAPRGKGDFLFFTGLVTRVKQAIDTGIFYPNPTGWVCSEQWCGYYKLCRGKEN